MYIHICVNELINQKHLSWPRLEASDPPFSGAEHSLRGGYYYLLLLLLLSLSSSSSSSLLVVVLVSLLLLLLYHYYYHYLCICCIIIMVVIVISSIRVPCLKLSTHVLTALKWVFVSEARIKGSLQ